MISTKILDSNPFLEKNREIMLMNMVDQKSTSISDTIVKKFNLSRTRQDIAKWRIAVITAENEDNPYRVELLRLYKDVVTDTHITALMETRKNAILSSKFIVMDKNGKEIKDKTDLINKQWFNDFIDLSLDSIFYGFSLIEFGDLENNEFDDVELVRRVNVRPEFSLVTEVGSMLNGVNFITDKKYNNWCIGVGKKDDLGLLMKAAPMYLYKRAAFTAWAQYNDMFGQPIRVVKTDDNDAETLLRYDTMAADMGNNGWIRTNLEDQVELLEGSGASGDVFSKMIDSCNRELSKLFLGQTGTTDEKSFAGSANVHERVMQEYNQADKRMIHFVLQSQLSPFLNNHGFGLEGLTIGIQEDDDLSIIERSKIDIQLAKYFDIDPEYIFNTYGTPVTAKIIPEKTQITEDNA